MIAHALVPLDGSPVADAAIPAAQALLPDDGELTLVRVVAERDPRLREWLGARAAPPLGGEDPEARTARADLEGAPARFPVKGAARGPGEETKEAG